MTNEQYLTMAGKGITSTTQAQQMGRKGGSVRTPKKKYAARLRELKKKGLKDETVKRLVEVMEDPECSILDIKLFLDTLKVQARNNLPGAIKLANAYIKLHQAHHGQKHHIQGDLNHIIIPLKINIIHPEENGNNTRTDNKLGANKKTDDGPGNSG